MVLLYYHKYVKYRKPEQGPVSVKALWNILSESCPPERHDLRKKNLIN